MNMKPKFYCISIIIFLFATSIFLLDASSSRLCKKGEGPKGFGYKKSIWLRYGHWCGPGFMGINSCYKDQLDKVCMEHDLCERRNVLRGRPAHSCYCDILFIKKARKVNRIGKLFARIIKQRNTKACLKRLK